MKRLTFITIMLTGLTAMHFTMASAGAAPSATDAGKQGVTGKVIQKKGNFMPGPAPEPGAPAPKRTEITLSVPVHVFKGKVDTFEAPNPKHPSLVKIVKAGKDGVYKVALDPGEYTVVAEIAGKLYLNAFSGGEAGKMSWMTVTVKAGEWTKFNIEDTSQAAF